MPPHADGPGPGARDRAAQRVGEIATTVVRHPDQCVFPVVPTIVHDEGPPDLERESRCLDVTIDAGRDGLSILANVSEPSVLTDARRCTAMVMIMPPHQGALAHRWAR